MKIKSEYNWPSDIKEAIALQSHLSEKVEICHLAGIPKIIAACDVAFIGPVRKQKYLVAGVILYDIERAETIERHSIIDEVTFPYIPGLLSFREARSVINAIELMRSNADVFLIDGQGIAHPRRFGLASHIGVLIGQPTVGCAKSRLTGVQASELPVEKGAFVDLVDRGETIGVVLRTRKNVKPLYISIGNKITLEESVKVVLACTGKYRLPEPGRIVHNYVTSVAKGMIQADKDYRK